MKGNHILGCSDHATPPSYLHQLQKCEDSGKGCKSPGYDEFNPPSWPSKCAPNKEDWIATSSAECRKPGAKYGNVFWQCSDIALVGCENLSLIHI